MLLPFIKKSSPAICLTIAFLLSGLTIFAFVTPANLQAACYCETPEDSGCRCTTSADAAGASYAATATGLEPVRCDTDYEANTYWSVINPVCGTAVETIPWCAPQPGDSHRFTCWGTEWTTGEMPSEFENADQEWVQITGPFNYNGGTFGSGALEVYVCRADNICCSRQDMGSIAAACDLSGVPEGYPCEPQNAGIDPPMWCTTYPHQGSYSCRDRDNSEFHTFRPYPSEPCDRMPHELALFCGNTLNLTDGFSIEKRWTIENGIISAEYYYTDDPNCPDPINWCPITDNSLYSCTSNGDGTETCTFTITDRTVNFFILLDGAFLPIMGNTERVVNRNRDEDALTDPQKVNEYVSWYLNGVTNNPSEYGAVKACIPLGEPCQDNPDNCCQGICGSNPLHLEPECTLNTLFPTPPPPDPDTLSVQKSLDQVLNFAGPLRRLLPHRIQRDLASSEVEDAHATHNEGVNIRHDQIIGCVRNIIGNPLSPLTWGKIVACYHEVNEFRRKDVRLTTFMEDGEDNNLPPQEEDFPTPNDWVFGYKEWRGQICFLFEDVDLPLRFTGDLRLGFCFNNPFAIDAYSDLFLHAPLSSTEDRVGTVDVGSVEFSALPASSISHVITSYSLEDTDPSHQSASGYPYAELYFSHMQETAELAESLQGTYVAQGEEAVTPVTNVEPPRWCDVREVRSNPGDDLYPENMQGNIIYSSVLECSFTEYDPGSGYLCGLLSGTECQESDLGISCCDYGQMDCPDGQQCVITNTCHTRPVGDNCSSNEYTCYNNCARGCTEEADDDIDDCGLDFNCARGCDTTRDPGMPTETCEAAIMLGLHTQTKTPKIDEIWSRLVAGGKGVFKKIFPKIETDAPIEAIWDIPASSPITFISPWLNSVGNPAVGRDVPELYFSHIGGLQQYFLKCIQTAIRPKGFGEACLSGSPGTSGSFYCACNPPIDYTFCVDQHPDINLAIRDYSQIIGYLGYIDFHPEGSPLLDANAPQLNTLLEGISRPAITSLYQVNNWDWTTNIRGSPIQRPSDLPSRFDWATLVGFTTNPGQAVLVPESGYDIGGGYDVLVLYATSNSITLKYTAEDNMIAGYGLHLENFNVDQAILDEYNQLNAAGRYELPALCAGKRIGTATGQEIRVAVRDTGAFLDPRWRDWWPNTNPGSENNCEIRRMQPGRECIIP